MSEGNLSEKNMADESCPRGTCLRRVSEAHVFVVGFGVNLSLDVCIGI